MLLDTTKCLIKMSEYSGSVVELGTDKEGTNLVGWPSLPVLVYFTPSRKRYKPGLSWIIYEDIRYLTRHL